MKWLLITACLAGQTTDLGTTLYQLHRAPHRDGWRATAESNLLLPKSPVPLALVKSGVAFTYAWGGAKLTRSTSPIPKGVGYGLLAGCTVSGVRATIHNARFQHQIPPVYPERKR